jgi:UDP-N-acetylmuramoyl-tripeptide--D-alanyl-D-alanine ligase
MRELGEHGEALHAGLAPAVLEAQVDELVLVGQDLRPLETALGGQVHVSRAGDADEAANLLRSMLRSGDAVLVKASNSVGLARVIERVSGERRESCST